MEHTHTRTHKKKTKQKKKNTHPKARFQNQIEKLEKKKKRRSFLLVGATLAEEGRRGGEWTQLDGRFQSGGGECSTHLLRSSSGPEMWRRLRGQRSAGNGGAASERFKRSIKTQCVCVCVCECACVAHAHGGCCLQGHPCGFFTHVYYRFVCFCPYSGLLDFLFFFFFSFYYLETVASWSTRPPDVLQTKKKPPRMQCGC